MRACADPKGQGSGPVVGAFAALHDASLQNDISGMLAALKDLFEVLPEAVDWFSDALGRPPSTILDAVEFGSVRAIDAADLRVVTAQGDEFEGELEDLDVELPDERIDRARAREQVRRGLGQLDPRDAFTIRGYYGIGVEERDLKALGAELGVGRERARQLRARGERRLSSLLRGGD